MKAKRAKGGSRDGGHAWKLYRSGGVDQVLLRDGADLAALRELDLKLWTALAMPTSGLDLDRRTAELLDSDGDGRIRPAEILAAVDWICSVLADPGEILLPGDSVSLSSIKDQSLAASARLLLRNLGKPMAEAVCMADATARARAFEGTLFNGDGVVPPEAAEDEGTRRAMEDIASILGSVPDRGGARGIDRGRLEAFFEQARAYDEWARRAEEPGIAPLGPGPTAAAYGALAALRPKVEDYFARCRLAAFDPRAATAVNGDEESYRELAKAELAADSPRVAALPLARAAAGAALPLEGPVNPAWAGALESFALLAFRPLAGGPGSSIREEEWRGILARLAPYEAWKASEPRLPISALGASRVAELLAGDARSRIGELLTRDEELASESGRIEAIERLVHYRRDLGRVLANFVNFSEFYGGRGGIFQAGILYLDARACSLCIEVADEARHAAIAALSGAFLVYCDLSRPGEQRRRIVAAVTDGDSDNLMAGRNGVFYDREGRDWDATVTRVVSNPISVREAFWLPYKKFSRMIEEQVAKRASAGEAASNARLSQTAGAIATADKPAPAAAKPEAKKFDLGTIALIGTAVGGVSAFVAGLFQTLFGLGAWLPLGLLGLVLVISGPSMILASLKLRRRNLGPILDANGWAINTQALVNIPFGAALTELAALPPGSLPSLADPFAEKKRPWRLYLALFLLAALAAAGLVLWRLGLLGAFLGS